MTRSFQHFGIVGGGAWGTALALALHRAGRHVTMWVHDPSVAAVINRDRQNKSYLPDIMIDPAVVITDDLGLLFDCDTIILATPAQHLRSVSHQLAPVIKSHLIPLLIAAKGIEQTGSALMSDVVGAELPRHMVAVLSGPSFAREVAMAQPTALTLAIRDRAIGEQLMHAMASPTFRLYLTDDVIGAQIGGAIKNVLAVACGIVAGRQLGENARAALITRGLAEMMRLGLALGGNPETLMGLSGLGDLVLTCSSPQSRNMSLGMELGQGSSLANILAARSSVTEGVYTAAAALALARQLKVDMPIVSAVDMIFRQVDDIDTVISNLLARPLKTER